MGRFHLLAALAALALAGGCLQVEPRSRPPRPEAPKPDPVGPAPTCLDGGVVCTAGTWCPTTGPDRGTCVGLPVSCTRTTDCAPHRPARSCVLKGADTASAAVGLCERPERHCDVDTDCEAGLICSAIGVCAPKAELEVHAGRVALRAACAADADCGLAGRCLGGACALSCESVACPSGWGCRDGRCTEPSSCSTDADCLRGNRCTESGGSRRCERNTTVCAEPNTVDDDALEQARPLYARVLGARSICGRDTDWHSIVLAEGVGARVVVTATRTGAWLDVEAVDRAGDPIPDATRLELPGLWVIDLPPRSDGNPDLAAGLQAWISVSSREASVDYDIALEERIGHCPADALDLYGPSALARPLTAPLDLALRLCPGDEDALPLGAEAGDLVRARLALDAPRGASVGLGLGSAGAATSTRTSGFDRATAIVATATATGSLVATVRGESTPTTGVDYRLELRARKGSRRAACLAPTAAPSLGDPALSSADDLGAPSCDWVETAAADRIYRLDVRAGDVVRALVRPRSGQGARAAVALLPECTSDEALSCAVSPLAGRAAAVEHVASADGRVFVLVSADTATAALELSVEAGVPSDNFACAAPAGITDVPLATTATTPFVYVVATEDGTDSVRSTEASTCLEAGLATGPDRFFALDYPGGNQRVGVRLSGPEGGLMWLSTACEGFDARCTDAAVLGAGRRSSLVIRQTQPQPYLLAVDGLRPTDLGPYRLEVFPNAACTEDADCGAGRACEDFACAGAPPNDVCPGQEVVLAGGGRVSLRGTTAAAISHYAHVCDGETLGANGPDVVYAVDLPRGAARFTARVTEAVGWDPILAVRGQDCARSTAQRGCNDDEVSGSLLPGLTLTELLPGTFYVIIDAWDTRGGAFTLDLEVVE